MSTPFDSFWHSFTRCRQKIVPHMALHATARNTSDQCKVLLIELVHLAGYTHPCLDLMLYKISWIILRLKPASQILQKGYPILSASFLVFIPRAAGSRTSWRSSRYVQLAYWTLVYKFCRFRHSKNLAMVSLSSQMSRSHLNPKLFLGICEVPLTSCLTSRMWKACS